MMSPLHVALLIYCPVHCHCGPFEFLDDKKDSLGMNDYWVTFGNKARISASPFISF